MTLLRSNSRSFLARHAGSSYSRAWPQGDVRRDCAVAHERASREDIGARAVLERDDINGVVRIALVVVDFRDYPVADLIRGRLGRDLPAGVG